MLYVGIDWAQQPHRVCLLDDRAIRGEFTVPNDAEGLWAP